MPRTLHYKQPACEERQLILPQTLVAESNFQFWVLFVLLQKPLSKRIAYVVLITPALLVGSTTAGVLFFWPCKKNCDPNNSTRSKLTQEITVWDQVNTFTSADRTATRWLVHWCCLGLFLFCTGTHTGGMETTNYCSHCHMLFIIMLLHPC